MEKVSPIQQTIRGGTIAGLRPAARRILTSRAGDLPRSGATADGGGVPTTSPGGRTP